MKIIVRGTNWIGDAVMTIPAIRKLRGLFPNAEITLHTREWANGIFRSTGFFNEIITTDGLFAQAREIRRGRFDLGIVFPNSFASALVMQLGGVKRRFGYASDRRGFLLTDPIAIPEWKNTRHEVHYYLNLIDAVEKGYFGTVTATTDVEPRIEVSNETVAEARTLLPAGGTRTIVIAPGSTNSRAKRWLPENFARLNDRMQSELGAKVILLGSKGDAEVSREVVELSSAKPFDLTGETNIETAAAVLSEADMLISNDMGLAHLAPAVGTKTIVIFGPTNPVTTRPFSENAFIVSANVECAPCMLRDCPIDHRCMTRVTADSVFERAKELLNDGN